MRLGPPPCDGLPADGEGEPDGRWDERIRGVAHSGIVSTRERLAGSPPRRGTVIMVGLSDVPEPEAGVWLGPVGSCKESAFRAVAPTPTRRTEFGGARRITLAAEKSPYLDF